MIGFFVLVGLVGVACVVAGSVAKPQPRKRLPLPTRDHEPRLLALVERVEAADRRVEAGCGLEQCAEHGKRWCDLALRKVAVRHKTVARAHEIGVEVTALRKMIEP